MFNPNTWFLTALVLDTESGSKSSSTRTRTIRRTCAP